MVPWWDLLNRVIEPIGFIKGVLLGDSNSASWNVFVKIPNKQPLIYRCNIF
jgi:hypothetical protein